ncbi:hypothetical protein H920_02773 [Fukomys damarensis]|uniref:Uncharacterized protein n=1 Tax=Fukomys damarensis TaxID=885580 RepID=A0A091DZC0_FUKDA|nr:hypothetical protein H920_02773 [Fukomys damarensis]
MALASALQRPKPCILSVLMITFRDPPGLYSELTVKEVMKVSEQAICMLKSLRSKDDPSLSEADSGGLCLDEGHQKR